MKGKYITTQILLACQSKPKGNGKNIHAQLAETIAERKKIMQESEDTRQKARMIAYLNFTQAA